MHFILILVFSFLTVVLAEAESSGVQQITNIECDAENKRHSKLGTAETKADLEECRATERRRKDKETFNKDCTDAYSKYSAAINDAGFKKGCSALKAPKASECVIKAEQCSDTYLDDEDVESKFEECPALIDIKDIRSQFKERKEEKQDLEDKIDEKNTDLTKNQATFSEIRGEIQRLQSEHQRALYKAEKTLVREKEASMSALGKEVMRIQSEIRAMELAIQIENSGSSEYRKQQLEIENSCMERWYNIERQKAEDIRNRVNAGRNQSRSGGFNKSFFNNITGKPEGDSRALRAETIRQTKECIRQGINNLDQDRAALIAQIRADIQKLKLELVQKSGDELKALESMQEELKEIQDEITAEFNKRIQEQTVLLNQAQAEQSSTQTELMKYQQRLRLSQDEYNKALSKKKAAERLGNDTGSSDSSIDDLFGGVSAYESALDLAKSTCCQDDPTRFDISKCRVLDPSITAPVSTSGGNSRSHK